jgi:hypothetical protein
VPQIVAVRAPRATSDDTAAADDGWHAPVGWRFLHGFRLGLHVHPEPDADPPRQHHEIKQEFGPKTLNMMLLGYEGFYRIVGHSWLNVPIVGNVTIAARAE